MVEPMFCMLKGPGSISASPSRAEKNYGWNCKSLCQSVLKIQIWMNENLEGIQDGFLFFPIKKNKVMHPNFISHFGYCWCIWLENSSYYLYVHGKESPLSHCPVPSKNGMEIHIGKQERSLHLKEWNGLLLPSSAHWVGFHLLMWPSCNEAWGVAVIAFSKV